MQIGSVRALKQEMRSEVVAPYINEALERGLLMLEYLPNHGEV